jgi:hypothetical protein
MNFSAASQIVQLAIPDFSVDGIVVRDPNLTNRSRNIELLTENCGVAPHRNMYQSLSQQLRLEFAVLFPALHLEELHF